MTALKANIEAIIIAASEPVSVENIAQVCDVHPQVIDKELAELAKEYEETERGFRLSINENGVRYMTSPECYDVVEEFITKPMNSKLSPSALETLAVIAYKQPVSRGQISSIRGVNADGVIKTLETRGYICEVARDSGPGQAVLYGTSAEFLDRLGIGSVSELPSLGDFVPDVEIMDIFEKSLLGDLIEAKPNSDAQSHSEERSDVESQKV